jgi:uncharacterized membrane protein YfcA
MSLAVVLTALPARRVAVPYAEIAGRWPVLVNLLAGGLAGAWAGASWATRMATRHVGQGPHLAFAADGCRNGLGPDGATHTFALPSIAQAVAGLAAGFAIVAAVMGVAGGEFPIPTIVLLYGIDTKLGRQPLPRRVVAHHDPGFRPLQPRYQAFTVLHRNKRLVITMTAGSIAGTLTGAPLLGVIPNLILVPGLALLLVIGSSMPSSGSLPPRDAATGQWSMSWRWIWLCWRWQRTAPPWMPGRLRWSARCAPPGRVCSLRWPRPEPGRPPPCVPSPWPGPKTAAR